MNQTAVLTFAAGLLLGATGGYLLAPKGSPLVAQNAASHALPAKAGAQGAAIHSSKDGAKPNNSSKPETDVTQAETEKAAEVSKMEAQQKKQMDKMKARLAAQLKLKVDEKLASLSRKLGLTSQQTEAMRPILEQHSGSGDMMTLMMVTEMNPSLSPEEKKEKGKNALLKMLEPLKNEAELDGALAPLMSPDQQNAYAQLKQEQRANTIEINANKELGKIQSSMTLTNEQKDQAFTVLSNLATEDAANPVPSIVNMVNMPGGAQHMEQEVGKETAEKIQALAAEATARKTRRIEAMQAILTPEQFSVYEAQQKDRGSDMGDFMSEMGAGMMMMHEEDASDAAPETTPDAVSQPAK